LAVCQLDLVKKCKQAGAARKRLRNLPKTLDETYDRILSVIPDETWEVARAALALLTYSLQPLTIQELAEGMVVDCREQIFDPDEHRLTNYREVLEICSSLVTIASVPFRPREVQWQSEKAGIERTNILMVQPDLEVVQFAHFSVKEYFMLERAKARPKVSRFSFSSVTAHREISETCLIYLLDFSRGKRLNRIDFQVFPLLAYTARYWLEHWRRQLALADQQTVDSLIRRMLDTDTDSGSKSYINYLNICPPDTLVGYGYGDQVVGKSLDAFPQPLYYTAQLGHYELCEWLLQQGKSDVNTRGLFGQLIHVAARFGHAKVIRLLIDHEAELNTFCGEYGYPLQAAAFGGHTEVVRLLLDNGADVNAQGGEFGSAFIAACFEGHMEAARVLLDRRADMDIVCVHKGKALNIAASSGNTHWSASCWIRERTQIIMAETTEMRYRQQSKQHAKSTTTSIW
jgi:hypothetical protein